jgi:hypothetical protein
VSRVKRPAQSKRKDGMRRVEAVGVKTGYAHQRVAPATPNCPSEPANNDRFELDFQYGRFTSFRAAAAAVPEPGPFARQPPSARTGSARVTKVHLRKSQTDPLPHRLIRGVRTWFGPLAGPRLIWVIVS